MARSIKWLFVYGTLLSRSRDPVGRDMRKRLQRHCLTRRPARVPGLLYDLGGYPGWTEQLGGNRWVLGEVILLSDVVQVFSFLDPYENFDALRPDASEYVRTTQFVLVGPAARLEAWLYSYRGTLANKRSIQSGNWLERS